MIFGLYFGWMVSNKDNFEYYKLLNVFGIVYDIIAVLLLSYAFILSDELKDKVVHNISLSVIVFSLVFPASFGCVGFVNSVFLGNLTNGVDLFVYLSIAISALPAYFLFSSPVLEPVWEVSWPLEKRLKVLGSTILFVGLAFQLVGAITDLVSTI